MPLKPLVLLILFTGIGVVGYGQYERNVNYTSGLFREMGTQAQAQPEPEPFFAPSQADSSWQYLKPPVTRKDIAMEFVGGLSGAYVAGVVVGYASYLAIPFLFLNNNPLGPDRFFQTLAFVYAGASVLGIAYGVFMVGNNLENRSANFWVTLAMTLGGTALGFALVSYLAPDPDSPQRIAGLLSLPLFAAGFGVWGYNLTSHFTAPPKREYYQRQYDSPPGFDYGGNGLLHVEPGKAQVRVPRMRGGYDPMMTQDWFFHLNLFKMRF